MHTFLKGDTYIFIFPPRVISFELFFHELIPLLLALQFFFISLNSHIFFFFLLVCIFYTFYSFVVQNKKNQNQITGSSYSAVFFHSHSWLYVSENKFLYTLFSFFLFFLTLWINKNSDSSSRNPRLNWNWRNWMKIFFLLPKKWMFYSLASLNVHSLRLRLRYVVNINVSETKRQRFSHSSTFSMLPASIRMSMLSNVETAWNIKAENKSVLVTVRNRFCSSWVGSRIVFFVVIFLGL